MWQQISLIKHVNIQDQYLDLIIVWRQHFLDKMAPKFLPPLWSVDHQKQRLDIRAMENRIDPADYSIANGGPGIPAP